MRKQPARMTVKLSDETKKWVDDFSYTNGLNKSALVNIAVEQFRDSIEKGQSWAWKQYELQEKNKD